MVLPLIRAQKPLTGGRGGDDAILLLPTEVTNTDPPTRALLADKTRALRDGQGRRTSDFGRGLSWFEV